MDLSVQVIRQIKPSFPLLCRPLQVAILCMVRPGDADMTGISLACGLSDFTSILCFSLIYIFLGCCTHHAFPCFATHSTAFLCALQLSCVLCSFLACFTAFSHASQLSCVLRSFLMRFVTFLHLLALRPTFPAPHMTFPCSLLVVVPLFLLFQLNTLVPGLFSTFP